MSAGYKTQFGEVIESKKWVNKNTGATASLYGAIPWSGRKGDAEEDWKLEVVGYTISWANGTVGIGRQPFITEKEAEEYLIKETGRRLKIKRKT